VNVDAFVAGLDSWQPAPVVLFCPFKPSRGRNQSFEPLLARRAVEAVTAKHVDPSMKDLCYNVYYADEADPAEIVSVAQTFPFLAERRVILVNNAERFDSASATGPLLNYLTDPSDLTLLMFVASQIDRRSKFFKACDKAGLLVECPALNEREALTWVRDEVEAQGKRIAGGAVRELVGRAGTQLSDVINAVTLVCNYVGDNDTVTEDDVTAACADVAEEEIWALTDAIASSNSDRALRVLREIKDLGKSEFEIMGSINWLLKSAYIAANPNAGNVSPFVAKKVMPLADKLGARKFPDAFALCMKTELMFRSTGVDRSLALELLVTKLSAPMPRSRQPARRRA
jgi:DNA polymerase III subunit delta